jgi:hypothetical protein
VPRSAHPDETLASARAYHLLHPHRRGTATRRKSMGFFGDDDAAVEACTDRVLAAQPA